MNPAHAKGKQRKDLRKSKAVVREEQHFSQKKKETQPRQKRAISDGERECVSAMTFTDIRRSVCMCECGCVESTVRVHVHSLCVASLTPMVSGGKRIPLHTGWWNCERKHRTEIITPLPFSLSFFFFFFWISLQLLKSWLAFKFTRSHFCGERCRSHMGEETLSNWTKEFSYACCKQGDVPNGYSATKCTLNIM